MMDTTKESNTMSEKLQWQHAECETCGWFKKESTQLFTKKEMDDGFVPKVSGICRKTNWAGSENTKGEDPACPAYVYNAYRAKCSECDAVEHFRQCDWYFYAKQIGWTRKKPSPSSWLCPDCSDTPEAPDA